MAPYFFSALWLRLDHQGECTGPHDNHHRYAHKEIFHVHRSAHKVCINDLSGLSIER